MESATSLHWMFIYVYIYIYSLADTYTQGYIAVEGTRCQEFASGLLLPPQLLGSAMINWWLSQNVAGQYKVVENEKRGKSRSKGEVQR